MGLNLDLTQLFGFPMKLPCPTCKKETQTDFNDYDIECGVPFTKGTFSLHLYCPNCEDEEKECEFLVKGKISFKIDGIESYPT